MAHIIVTTRGGETRSITACQPIFDDAWWVGMQVKIAQED
jgi:hypothetical protein